MRILEAHNPVWAVEFCRVRTSLQTFLKSVPIHSIEYVASTSIPSLVAKPVLNIDIIASSQHLASASAALVSSGYVAIGEYGVPGCWAFRQPGFLLNARDGAQAVRVGTGETEMRRNVYVVLEGCVILRNHLDISVDACYTIRSVILVLKFCSRGVKRNRPSIDGKVLLTDLMQALHIRTSNKTWKTSKLAAEYFAGFHNMLNLNSDDAVFPPGFLLVYLG